MQERGIKYSQVKDAIHCGEVIEDQKGGERMKCLRCKGEMQNGYTTHTVDLGKCCIVIRRVPCMKCDECGEIVFSGTVMATLEKLMDTMQSALTEVAVMNYPGAVA